jgi:hypothetical protein
MNNAFAYLVEKQERKRLRILRIPGRRWEDDVKMDLRDIGFTGFTWLTVGTSRDIL